MADYPPPWDVPQARDHALQQDVSLSQTAAALANMLDENKEEKVLKEACVRLCQLFGEGIQNDRIQAILEANVVPKLVALLRPSRARAVPISVQSAALQVLGNVACGDDRQTQVVIDSDALPCLRALLASADRGIRKEVCWIVSNITESSHQVQDVLDADILPPLLKLLDSQDAACREDATWVLFNLSSNREPRQISYLADKNGVRALCNLLTCGKDLDVLWKGCGTVAAVALKGLRNILICGQQEAQSHPLGYNRMAALVAEAHGVERIEALTTHASHDVRLRARLLLERMFSAETSTVDLQPVVPNTTPASSTSSIAPSATAAHAGCSCNIDHRHQSATAHPHHHYPPPTFDAAVTSASSSLSISVDQNGLPAPGLGEQSGSTSPSTTDSDPEDEDSDSDLIPPPPAPCMCILCTDSSPLTERRPRGKPVDDQEQETRQLCDFCSGSGRLGDGRAGLAAKLGRAVRLGHSHCLAVLLSRMTWSQRAAATDAPALLHPGGGPPAGGYGSNVPAITLAAQLGKPECLALLLRRCKPDLNQTYGKRRYTPLAWAASKGYVRCTRLLIEHGADPATTCAEGTTALHLAASSSGNVAICKLLLECKAPVNALTEKKQTPLCLAAQKGNWKIVQLLLAHGANPNNEDVEKYTPLHLAASSGFVDCLNLLLKADAVVDCKTLKSITPLHYAVQGGHPSCVQLLINAGAKVNCAKKPLLLIAADEGKSEVVQILLDALAKIDCKAYVKAYLDKDTEISDHLTPLHLAASKGNLDVVELLLRRGANVDATTDNSRWTALDFAVLNGHTQCAMMLLKHGASVPEQTKNIGRNNWTLVQHAANQGAKEVVRQLVQRLKDQRVKAKGGNKFSPSSPDFGSSNSHEQMSSGVLAPLAPASDSLSFPSVGSTPSRTAAPTTCVPGTTHAHHHHIGGSNARQCNHAHDQYPVSHSDDFRPPPTPAQHYDARTGATEKRCSHGHDGGCGNVTSSSMAPESSSGTTRRRAHKEEREASRRARDIKKREDEAAEARVRLDEAISQRSIAKLTEAISHVSKLVLHLATSAGGETTPTPNGSGADYADDGYGGAGYADPGVTPANGAGNGRHPSPAGSSTNYSSATTNAPLPVEVGLGNEVIKARKMLAELQGEERRARDERAREAADNKRDTAQQSVRKAMSSTLQGGDSRILVRTVNRALRTILDSDDPVILEAKSVSQKIEQLEKAEEEMSNGKRDRDLEVLTNVIPLVENGLKEVKKIKGQGAAERIFGPSGPEAAINEAKKLCEELLQERRAAEEQRAKAEDRERRAKEMLAEAMSSGELKRMEDAIEDANAAVISKDSELSSAIDASKKQFAKILKGERRKLRQANSSNDADMIDAAVEAAMAKGLKSLEADIKASRDVAQRLRDQKQATIDLSEAIDSSDMSALAELRTRLKDLGMFEEEDRARSELERLQRATRARTLLENAIADAKENIETYKKKAKTVKEPSSANRSSGEWTWPDTQRLHDLAERSRKYGTSMQKLCDSAVELLKTLGNTGREVLRNSINSDDATFIAASITGYEKSFMQPTFSGIFGKEQGNRIIQEAKKKLNQVQAADQAKVRAESRQVKQSFAMASSRRHNVKNRGTRKDKTKDNQSKENSKDSSTSTPANGAKHETRGLESTNSSEYGGDDEASDIDGGAYSTPGKEMGHSVGPWSKTIDHRQRQNGGMRRPRAPPSQRSVDEQIASETGSHSIGGSSDCAHYYLHKEGLMVVCVHCGNIRTTGNPEWLSRVKRRGTNLADPIPISPPHPGMTPPTNVRPPVLGNPMIGTNSPVTHLGAQTRGLSHRPARAAPALVGSLPIGPQTMGYSSSLPVGASQTPYMTHHGHIPVSAPHLNSLPKRSGKPSSATTHRTRGRHHDLNAAGMDGLNRGAPLYGRAAMGGAVSLGRPSHVSMRHRMGYQPEMMAAPPPPVVPSAPHVDRQTGGLAPLSSMYGVPRMPVSPVGSTSLSLQGLGLGMGGDTRGVGEDITSESTDLGVEFANQNFGFDIDAIVDDNPPPPAPPEIKRRSPLDAAATARPGEYY